MQKPIKLMKYTVFQNEQYVLFSKINRDCTGKSLSEALIFVSTNPQDDNRWVQYMTIVVYIGCSDFWMSKQKTICVHNMFWAWNFHVLNS